MSTSNFITDSAHNSGWLSDPEADPPSSKYKEGKSRTVEMNVEHTDAIFEHLSRTCSVRELVQLQCVSKTWKTSISNNMAIITKARVDDKYKDWYFPLYFKLETYYSMETSTPGNVERLVERERWTWSGVHHSSGLVVHRLPLVPDSLHVPHFPSTDFGNTIDCRLASSGGLLLVTDKLTTSATSQNWRSLVVWNPVTHRCRELPTVDCRDVGLTSWNYNGAEYHMMVDEQANSYKVFITFRTSLCVYSSTSDSWKCHAFKEPVPWGVIYQNRTSDKFLLSPSAILDGKLFYANLETVGRIVMPTLGQSGISDLDVRTRGRVRVFEIDEEACTWKPPVLYAMQNYFSQSPNENYGLGVGSYAIKIVECMGGLYAIIPAELHGLLTFEDGMMRTHASIQSYGHDGYLVLHFYILKLQGNVGLDLGQLLIENPCTSGNSVMPAGQVTFRHRYSKQYLEWVMNGYSFHLFPKVGGWFRCTSRGNVISLSWWDYLLQYDVLSGQSKTEIIRDGFFEGQPDFSYRPSVQMNP